MNVAFKRYWGGLQAIICLFLFASGPMLFARVDLQVAQILGQMQGDKISGQLMQELKTLAPKSYPKLKQVAADSNSKWQHRWVAVMALSADANKTNQEAVFGRLKDKHFLVRLAAIKASQNFDNISAYKAVGKALLEDKSLIVRNAAVKTLSQEDSALAIEFLSQALVDPKNHKKGLWIYPNISRSLMANNNRFVLKYAFQALEQSGGVHWPMETCNLIDMLVKKHHSQAYRAKPKSKECRKHWLEWKREHQNLLTRSSNAQSIYSFLSGR